MKNTQFFIKELRSLANFLKTPNDSKAILFYAERRGYYPYFEGIINELIEKHHQNISYVTSDPDDPLLETENPRIKSFYLKKLLPIFFQFIKCKVFVMTLLNLNQFHLRRSIYPVHYVYVFHSLASTHMAFRPGSFDHYDSILCPGPQHFDEIRKYEETNGLKKKQLVQAGCYRLEKLFHEYQNYKEGNPKESPTILIAPSWGEGNILEYCGKELISQLLSAAFEVIVRPHSETVKRNPQLVANLNKNFANHPKFKLELLSSSMDSLLRADILISDYSGIALSFAFGTGKPVLFIDVPPKIKNPEYKKLGIEPLELSLRSVIGVALAPQELHKVPAVIRELIEQKESYRRKNFELREKYIYSFGRSAETGAGYIMDLIRSMA